MSISIWHPYDYSDDGTLLSVKKTSGNSIYLSDGTILLDGISSWWSACHGYNHAYIIDKIKKQLDLCPHIMFAGAKKVIHEPAYELSNKLNKVTEGYFSKIHFSDSGSTSIEVALRMTVEYWQSLGFEKKTKFLSFYNSYHGDTMAAASLCDPSCGMHASLKNYFPKQYYAAVPEDTATRKSLHDLMEQNTDNISAVIIEPFVQGAGGMKFHSVEALSYIRELCDKFSIPLVFDEIAVGFAKLTGKMFAFQHANIVPDILCLGKALTAGMCTMGATLANKNISDVLSKNAFYYGTTFMANALSCQVASASLDIFATYNLPVMINGISQIIKDKLSPLLTLDRVKDVRSMGVIGVVQLVIDDYKDIDWLRRKSVEYGIWIRPFRDVVYIIPSINITEDNLTLLLDRIILLIHAWLESKKS